MCILCTSVISIEASRVPCMVQCVSTVLYHLCLCFYVIIQSCSIEFDLSILLVVYIVRYYLFTNKISCRLMMMMSYIENNFK